MTTPRGERSLPLRVPIRDGEALDSWTELLARRSGMPMGRLLPALGVPSTAMQTRHTLIAGTPLVVLRRIERQTGLPSGRLDAAVIDRYHALHWPVLDGSRYCPDCLAETGGRWQLRWRLPWVFACLPHRLLLVDCCRGCGLLPRRRIAAAAGLHPAAACPNLIIRGHLCATDLRTAPARRLPVDDPMTHTQKWIESQLGNIESGTDSDAGLLTSTLLADLNAVGQWRRIQSTADDFRPFGPEAIQAFTAYLAGRRGDRRPPHHAFTDSLLVGATATFAVALLNAQSEDDILAGLRPLTRPRPGMVQSGRRPRGTTFGHFYQWKTLSSDAQGRFLAALDTHLSPVDRLRYRSCSPTPRLPDSAGPVLDRASHIPQMLWPEWAIRFTPNPRCAHPDPFRAAISVCLLIPGRFEKDGAKIASALHYSRPSRLPAVILGHLVEQAGDSVLTAICLLADYLDEHGSPIDYQHRRAIITDNVLSEQQWKQLCRRAMTHPGKAEQRCGPSRRFLVARRYLLQLLTGADLSDDRHPLAFRSHADRARYMHFIARMSSPLRSALHEHAVDHLRRLGIDEPLSWAPPMSICAGLDLPGRDPADIDLERLRRLLIDEGRTTRDAARDLGTTLAHVRLAVERIPREPAPWAANLAQARHQREQQRNALLTREFFQRECKDAGKTLTRLHAETSIPIKILSQHARRVGSGLVGHRPARIDPTWLAEQYLQRRRSFTHIAKELGVNAQTVTDSARRHGIPVRVPGIQSHPDLIIKLDLDIPIDIRRAVEGQLHAWQRLRRFQQAMAYPSLSIASKELDVHTGTLNMQFRRLERDVGTELFQRSTPTKPKQLTQRGNELLAALELPQVRLLLHCHDAPPRKSKTCSQLKKRPDQ